ncbi:MAG TPA: hypothetical protein VGG75_15940 [Trebonia sp.]|jgi:hypothetical protein
MQWHWGNIGSALQGFAAVIVAIGALIKGPAVVRAWIDRMRAQAEEARARAAVARAEAEEIAFDRRRTLSGWSPGGVTSFTTAVVTDPDELKQAARELSEHKPGTDSPLSRYVVLRVDEDSDVISRGRDLRALIREQGAVGRLPTRAEREALERGFDVLGISHVMHWP